MTRYPMGIEGAVFESSKGRIVPSISFVFERLKSLRLFSKVLNSNDCRL